MTIIPISVEVLKMIYKFINYLKSVSVEGEHGVEQLRHNPPYYENDHVCLEIKEVSHNEIEIQVKRCVFPIHQVHLEFLNPMENIKSQLGLNGEVQPFKEVIQPNPCYICSDLGTYAFGIEADEFHQGTFLVNQQEVWVDIPMHDIHQPNIRLVFEKYLSVHPNQEIISRFNELLTMGMAQ